VRIALCLNTLVDFFGVLALFYNFVSKLSTCLSGFFAGRLTALCLTNNLLKGSYALIASKNSSLLILPSPSRSILLIIARWSISVVLRLCCLKNRSRFFR